MCPATAPLKPELTAPVGAERELEVVAREVDVAPGEVGVAPGKLPRALDAAFERRLRSMLDRYFDFIWRSLRRLGVTAASVDDAAQRVFWVAAQNVETIEPDRERAYLFSVAVRVASEWRRAESRRREVHSEDDMSAVMHPSPGPDELLEQKRARETLDALLDELSLELRTVLVLVEGEGLRAHEVAEILAIPEGTVSSRLRRARAALAESIERFQKRSASRRGPRA